MTRESSLRAGLCSELDETYLVQVYVDRVFGTFAFQKLPALINPVISGIVLSASGRPLAKELVTISIGGKSYATYTDKSGVFHFYSKEIATGPGSVTIRNKVRKRFTREPRRPVTGLDVKLA